MSSQDLLTEVSDFLQDMIIHQCIQAAIGSLLVYDTTLTMDKEIKYFWTKKWYRPTHVLFFINRYIGIFGAISKLFLQTLGATIKLCSYLTWAASISDIFVEVIIDYILTLRILALWNKSKILSITLYSLIICEAVAKFALMGIGITVEQVRTFPLTGDSVICGAYTSQLEHLVYFQFIDWVITAAIGSILLSLAFFKTIEHWRLSGLNGSNLVNMIIKDQIIYYLIAINIVSTRIAFLGSFPQKGAVILDFLGNSGFLCLAGSRMFLNLKEAGDAGVNEGTDIPSNNIPKSTISGVDFAAPASSSSDSEIHDNPQESHPSIIA